MVSYCDVNYTQRTLATSNNICFIDFVDSDQKSTLSGMLSENVKRRQLLPSPSVGDAASALSVFRKNVGKDLSTIAMPISMNEPLNLLQKACEELEYCQLLTRANQAETSIDRLMYVTCFAVSGYASSQYRTGRKVRYLLDHFISHQEHLINFSSSLSTQ